MTLSIVVMAAGKGTRMKSDRPKVLHTLAGKPLLQHVLDTCVAVQAQKVVVVTGHEAEQVEAAAAGPGIVFARQVPQLGTGHAMQMAVPHLPEQGMTLVLYGDVPLIQPSTARALMQACGGDKLALLTVMLDDATGYGRIVRQGGAADGTVIAIVEQKDATPAQRAIREGYTGIMVAPSAWLKKAVMGLTNDNAQKEYYLTDVVALAVAQGMPVVTAHPGDKDEVMGVNSQTDLAQRERALQRMRAHTLTEAGVHVVDPARIDIRGELVCGRDVEIDINCVFEGRVVLEDGARVGAHCVLRNATIGAGAKILPFTHMDGGNVGVRVGAAAEVGPFARLRPGANLGPEVHIGNFVEVKNSTLARGAKANHLAYLGDATVGERVNYGAGSITANYDGANKHPTVIGNDVHIGSNCVLVAPITIGDGATVGAGSTLSKSAPAGKLTVARGKAVTIEGWTRPVKKSKGAG